MRILLIVPTHNYSALSPRIDFLSASDFPTGIAYLASSLKEAGHQVYGCNPNNAPQYPTMFQMVNAVIRKSLETVPGLIGLGGLCTDYHFIKDAMGIIRKVAPMAPIVLGGGIVTYDAEFIMNLLRPDFCIIGEGEETLVKLADMIESGKLAFDEIDNIGYWEG